MLFVNVEYQRHLFLSTPNLVFMSFLSPFQELQNDAKISRKKHWPAHKLLENTVDEPWFYRFLPLLSLFSSIKVNKIYFKSMIFRNQLTKLGIYVSFSFIFFDFYFFRFLFFSIFIFFDFYFFRFLFFSKNSPVLPPG